MGEKKHRCVKTHHLLQRAELYRVLRETRFRFPFPSRATLPICASKMHPPPCQFVRDRPLPPSQMQITHKPNSSHRGPAPVHGLRWLNMQPFPAFRSPKPRHHMEDMMRVAVFRGPRPPSGRHHRWPPRGQQWCRRRWHLQSSRPSPSPTPRPSSWQGARSWP